MLRADFLGCLGNNENLTPNLDKFAKADSKKVKEVRKKLEELGISRLKPRHVNKIIDIMPKDIGSLRAVFAGENITLKQEDLKKILECLK